MGMDWSGPQRRAQSTPRLGSRRRVAPARRRLRESERERAAGVMSTPRGGTPSGGGSSSNDARTDDDDDDDDDALAGLPPDHPLLERAQRALRAQLLDSKRELEEKIKEKGDELNVRRRRRRDRRIAPPSHRAPCRFRQRRQRRLFLRVARVASRRGESGRPSVATDPRVLRASSARVVVVVRRVPAAAAAATTTRARVVRARLAREIAAPMDPSTPARARIPNE